MRPGRVRRAVVGGGGAAGAPGVPLRVAVLGVAGSALALAAVGAPPRSGPAQEVRPSPSRGAAQALVADLTGWRPTGQVSAFARSTPAERARAAATIAEALQAIGLVPRLEHYRFRNVNPLVDLLLPPYRGANVTAEVAATDPDADVVIVGAHYDSEPGSPGAVDNASGVAVVWGVAAEIARLDARARNFLFVFFDQEEDDEVGSRAFARLLAREGRDVHSVHVVDLAGWDEDGDRGVEIQSPAPHLEPLYRRAAMELSIPLAVIGGASSDNKSFIAAGFPSVGVFEDDMTPHIHSPGDTFETMDFELLSVMTELVTRVMRELARP